MSKSASVPICTVKLHIAEPLHDHYSERAMKHGRDVEDEMVQSLRMCRDHVDTQPIYLNDQQRQELSAISGRLLKTPEDVLAWARQLTALHVGGVDISLGQQLITRLESRRFGKTWKEFMQALVPEKLEEHVGLR
jgi:hypothetical protein